MKGEYMEKLDELYLKLEDVQASAEDQPHPPELARPCHAPLAAADKITCIPPRRRTSCPMAPFRESIIIPLWDYPTLGYTGRSN